MMVRELFAGEEVVLTGPDVEVAALTCDSRRVVPGALFAAWRGTRADGHDHIPAALERGASAILCEREIDTGSAARVHALNARRVLARAARRFFADPAARLCSVGVTGTNGKTTTVHLLEGILAAAGHRPAVLGTLGTRFAGKNESTGLTTPESVDLLALLQRMLGAGCTALAMEVSSHALTQERVAGVDFDVGIFTNLTHDHLDYHGTFEEYFAAKRRLFFERLKVHGQAVLNLDDAWGARLAGELSAVATIGFSLDFRRQAEVRATELDVSREGIRLVLSTPIGELRLVSPLLGRFNAANLAAAASAGVALHLPIAAIEAGVAAVSGVPGRFERVPAAGGPLVLVDYAHTPDALAKVLQAAREVTDGRLFCVFGCGGDRDQEKRPVMGQVAAAAADWTVVTNDNPRGEEPGAILARIEEGLTGAGAIRSAAPVLRGYWVEPDRQEAIAMAITSASPVDTVVIAGKGHEGYQLVGDERRPFDDRAQARQALTTAGFSGGR